MTSREAKETLVRLVAKGRERHIAGDLAAAEPLFREALAIDGDDPEALHRLGMILDLKGEPQAAIELIQRSILRAPTVPEFFNNLGEALRRAGRRGEAQRAYERALQLRPAYAEALNNLALVLLDIGDGRALECAQSAVRLAPGVAQVHVTLGRVLHAEHDHRRAAAALREAVRLAPANVEARTALVTSLAALGEPLDEWFESLPPRLTAVALHNAAADGFLAAGRTDEALRQVDRALAIDPNHFESLTQLGAVQFDRGEPAAALDAYRRALGIKDVARVRHAMAFALLALGEYANGFREYEHRPKAAGPTDRGRAVPQWTGAEPVAGRTILLTAEQGIGDTIQFIRYAPMLAARGAKVWVQVGEPIARLARAIAGVERVWTPQQPKGFDLHCPLGSVPHAFGTELDSVPADVPYVHADPARLAAWRQRLDRVDAALKVGIVWQGNPRHPRDRMRSIPLAILTPLTTINGVRLFSLQKGEGRDQLAAVAGVEDLNDHLDSFDDTAAAIAALDLVISVDTSVAHLAGALGRPVWTLIAIPTDWRWLIGRSDSPWYPTMRLYRQSRAGDWSGVVARVADDLAALARR